jgi:dTDP-4-amino-4,6-dideoxygalactose transaminase
MIPVTQPFLPIEVYKEYLNGIWKRNWLTNHGPLVNLLEEQIKQYCALSHVLFVSNGTLALQIAIRALEINGDIITTPFSYVATTSSIVWEGCNPIYVDIDEKTLTINVSLIEDALTDNTKAILVTHVYGIPCDVEAIEKIANKHNLKVIYDAAHSFGVKYNGKSLYDYGDISTASFHATKLFHTVEGGAVISNSNELISKMAYLRNFGHESSNEFAMIGINGKNSELHAAMGLSVLKYMDDIILRRKKLSEYYDLKLKSLNFKKPLLPPNTIYNYSYYPIIFSTESDLIHTMELLIRNQVFPRRYFYPSLNTLDYVENQTMPVSENISKKVLCLPLYFDLTFSQIDFITRILFKSLNQ